MTELKAELIVALSVFISITSLIGICRCIAEWEDDGKLALLTITMLSLLVAVIHFIIVS